MRYVDGPTTEAEIDIDAPIETVWALVTDIQLPARFSHEFVGADWLGGADGIALGATFVGRNQHAATGPWETISTIVELEPYRSFAWAVGDLSEPSATWRFDLEPRGDSVTLRQWMRMGPGWSGILPAIEAMPDKEERIIVRRLSEHQANMQLTLEGIKRLAETPVESSWADSSSSASSASESTWADSSWAESSSTGSTGDDGAAGHIEGDQA